MYDLDALKLRLDMQKLHQDIENFLAGTRTTLIYNSERGEYTEQTQRTGENLANNKGIQILLSFVVTTVNSHTVQGNTTEQGLNKILEYMHDEIAADLTKNWRDYGINPNSRAYILNTIMQMVQLVLSRTVNNEERISYSGTKIKSTTLKEEEKRRGLI